MNLSEAWIAFERDRHYQLSSHSIAGYTIQLRLLIRALGDRTIDGITTVDLKDYLNGQTHLKASSLAHRVRVLKSFFGWLREEGHINANPAAKLKEPKQPKLIPKAIPEDDLEMIRESCIEPRERSLVELLYSTGCRIGEVYGLSRHDIQWDFRSIIVYGKGSKEREVYFSRKAHIWLKKYIETRSDDNQALFVTERNFNGQPRRLSIAQLRTVVKEVAKRAKIKSSVSPHRMRHSYATHLLENGAPIEIIQSLMGHQKIETTKIYAQLSGPRRRELYQRYF